MLLGVVVGLLTRDCGTGGSLITVLLHAEDVQFVTEAQVLLLLCISLILFALLLKVQLLIALTQRIK